MAITLPTLGMLKPDEGQGVPSVRQMLDVWSALPVEVATVGDAAGITNLLHAFERTHDNGGARLHRFRIGEDRVFDWFASSDRLREIEFPRRFLLLPAVRTVFDCAFDEATILSSMFEPVSGFSLDGQLAQWLFSGGAYHQSEGNGTAEKAAGLAFVEAMFDNRFADVAVWRCDTAWCPWFSNVAWDATWVILDRRTRELWLWCVTDTD